MILPLHALNAGEPPLPSVDSVLHRVLERAEKEGENDRRFNEQYIYSNTKLTEYRNAGGDLKKKEEKTSEHNPTVVRAALRPRSNRPASQPRTDAGQTESGSNTTTNVRGKAFEKSNFPLNDDLFKRFHFTLVKRETLNDRPTLVLDFVPAGKNLPERNIKDRFINKAAGRAWVDEADFAVVKADLRLSEKVSVVGGLVGAIWKFTFGFDRQRLPDGLWFTRISNWHLEGREFLSTKTIDYHEEKAGVRNARPSASSPAG